MLVAFSGANAIAVRILYSFFFICFRRFFFFLSSSCVVAALASDWLGADQAGEQDRDPGGDKVDGCFFFFVVCHRALLGAPRFDSAFRHQVPADGRLLASSARFLSFAPLVRSVKLTAAKSSRIV